MEKVRTQSDQRPQPKPSAHRAQVPSVQPRGGQHAAPSQMLPAHKPPLWKSVTSLRRGPPLPSKPEYKARLLRASPRRCADGLRIIEAQVTSPHTHTRGTHRSHPRGCRLPYTKHYSHDTRGSGGAAAAAAAARAGGRIRIRSSDGAEQRPPGRPLLCLPERAVCLRSSSAVRCGRVFRPAGSEGDRTLTLARAVSCRGRTERRDGPGSGGGVVRSFS